MNHFHPDIHWLTEYAAGNLPLSQALCISAHISFCPQCKKEVEKLNSLGGMMLASSDSGNSKSTTELPAEHTDISESLRSQTLNLLNNKELMAGSPSITSTVSANDEPSHSEAALPRCLNKLIPNGTDKLEWKSLGSAVSVARLAAGDTDREVALHKIKAGGSVGNHDHKGLEVTVVLAGSFSDQNGQYLPGDFLVKNAGESHRPIASEDADCICLSVLEAPVKFTGPIARLINPFLRIHTAAS
ncbi:MAG: ChrR family anti-sigma-E factor [Pseudomonadales bacterium]|nr:ChrR family anti-sigma-E factor [Pseudomonadales bacterium]